MLYTAPALHYHEPTPSLVDIQVRSSNVLSGFKSIESLIILAPS